MKQIISKIEQEIWQLQKKLKELKPHIDYNHALAIVYNRTLIEKAILVDKRNKILNKPNLIQKVKKVLTFNPKKNLICDFFGE